MSETTNLKLFKHDNPATNTNQFDVEKALNQNWDKIDEAVGKNRQELNSELNLLSGVEEVETLTTPATWANRTWRSASGGTGTRERIDIENGPNSNFKKGWKLTGSTGGNTDICQDFVPISYGQSYRLSCYARKVSGEPILRMQYGKNPYTSETYQINNTEWQKYELIFEAGKTNANCSEGNTNIYFGISNCVGVLEICGLRLEKVDDELKNRIDELEKEKEYLRELNSSLQETVLDTQTEMAKTLIVNDSVERCWNDKYSRRAISRK